MTEAEQRVIIAAHRYDMARKSVLDWVTEQTAALRLVHNAEAPGWHDYLKAKTELFAAINELGDGQTILPSDL